MENKLIKACYDILSCNTDDFKKSTIEELKKIILSDINDSNINEDLKEDKIKEIVFSDKGITNDDIKNIVCNEFNITLKEMNGRSRKNKISHPRQIAMYIVRKYKGYSYPIIASIFNRLDHTTIIHAYNKIEDDLKNSSYLRTKVTKILNELELF